MVKVQDFEWAATGKRGAPKGAVFTSEWMNSEDATDVSESLKKRGIDFFKYPNIDETLFSLWVCNYTEKSEYDPALARKFFKAFPGVEVEEFDVRLLQLEPVLRNPHHNAGGLSWQFGDMAQMMETETAEATEKNPDNKPRSPIDEEMLAKVMTEIDGMIGLGSAKQELKQIIAMARIDITKRELGVNSAEKPCYHMCFSGNPGTGKTTFARLIAKAFHALGVLESPDAHEVLRSDLVGDHIGFTEKQTTEHIDKAYGGVLFIDEAYALAGTGERGDRDFGRKAIDTIVPAMENFREEMIFVFAGYGGKMKEFMDENPGLKSRCPINVTFEDFNSNELGQVMDAMLTKKHLVITPEAREQALKRMEQIRVESAGNFGNARDVRNLIEAMERTHALNVATALGGNLSADEKRKLLTTISPQDVPAAPVSSKPVARKLDGMGFMAKWN